MFARDVGTASPYEVVRVSAVSVLYHFSSPISQYLFRTGG